MRRSARRQVHGWGGPVPHAAAHPACPALARAARAARRSAGRIVGQVFIVGALSGGSRLLCRAGNWRAAAMFTSRSNCRRPTNCKSAPLLFVSHQIYARDGTLLYELMDPNGGKRQKIPLSANARRPHPRHARHRRPQLLPPPRLRPGRHRARRVVRRSTSASSSRAARPSRSSWCATCSCPTSAPTARSSARSRRSCWRMKSRAATHASKILEMYLNEAYYGNLAYGVEAASQTYFGKSAQRPDAGRSLVHRRSAAIARGL